MVGKNIEQEDALSNGGHGAVAQNCTYSFLTRQFCAYLKQGHKNLCVTSQNTNIHPKTDTGLLYCNTGVEIIISVYVHKDRFWFVHLLKETRSSFLVPQGPLHRPLIRILENERSSQQYTLFSTWISSWHTLAFFALRIPPAHPCGFRTWSLFTNRMHNLELYITWIVCHKQHHRCP